ncbi:MAG: GntR family transcriptional regulator [Alphaproteobacteria bacterium]|nr:GntR family transcriptional regulator [Alphaproteobacteria bacterium]
MPKQENMKTADKTTNLADWAYEQLKAMAVTYQLRPGERLAELEIAKRLNVSRTPIREAMNRLVSEGFLVLGPNRSFQCRPLDAKEIFDLYEVRRSLEAASARLAVERASDEELEDLALFLKGSRSAPADTSVMELVRLDEEFHERIARLSRNAEYLRILQNINARIRFCRWIDMENDRRSNTQSEHASVLAALQARDADRCAEVMNSHIARRLDQIVEVIREGFARIYMGEYARPRTASRRRTSN